MRRDPIGPLVILLLIAALSAVVWMTRHPESELLTRAEEWPLVGSLVEAFRERYSAPSRLVETAVEEEASREADEQSPSPPAIAVRDDLGRVWVRAGTSLRKAAEADSALIATIEKIRTLPVLERDGDWYKVVHERELGWVLLPGYGQARTPPLGSEPEPPKPLAGRSADPELLRMALDVMRGDPRRTKLGPYWLATDHVDPQLEDLLAGVAESVEPIYRDRYGLAPIDRPRETVLLYSAELGYRRLQDSLGRVSGLPSVGLMSRGVVAVFAGNRRSNEIAATLVHELTHLINRRALGPALPPWLDEGIAGDLALSAISERGRLDPTRLAGASRDIGSTRIWWGGQATARELQRALSAEGLIPLRRLLELDWESFVDPAERLTYPQSALVVRFLGLSGSTQRAGFLDYLKAISRGGRATPDALLARLGMSWDEVESEFRSWLLPALAEMTRGENASDQAARRVTQ